MRIWVALLLALLMPLAVAGNHRDIIVNGQRLTNRVVFVLDVSGSMANCIDGSKDKRSKYQIMRAELRSILEQMADDGKVKFIAFGAYPVSYSDKWLNLPDEDGVALVMLWLNRVWEPPTAANVTWYASVFGPNAPTPSADPSRGDISSATYLVPPMKLALAELEPELSILILSDADFHDYRSAADEIARDNAARTFGPCAIAIEGIGTTDGTDKEVASKIAEASHSYFLRIK